MSAAVVEEVIWHEAECGRYGADLPIWSGLVAAVAGPVLELGCGSGRVTLHLAAGGARVSGVDSSPALIAELERRAANDGLAVDGVVADARELELEGRFGAILAPMQFVHLLGGPAGRARLFARVSPHLRDGGIFAAAVLTAQLPAAGTEQAPVLPDVVERDGYVYSSLPIEVVALAGAIEVRRLRQVVSPEGELSERVDAISLDDLDPERFEAEARDAGLRPRERLEIAPTADHVGSTVCVLEVGR